MTTYLLLAGFLITVFFFLIDKNMLPGAFIGRKHILTKFEKNKKKEQQLHNEFEALVNSYCAWSQNAFPDSDVTYAEYLDLLKEKSSIEYSDAELETLKSKLKRQQIIDYNEKIRNQEEAVIALQKDLARQKRNLQSLAIAKAS
jgi:lipopolysaccharide export LptBFGC system permease protein LptF